MSKKGRIALIKGILILAAAGIIAITVLRQPENFRDKYEGVDLETDVAGLSRSGTYLEYLGEQEDRVPENVSAEVDLFDYTAEGDVEILSEYEGEKKVLSTSVGSDVTWTVKAPKSGLYNLYLEYLLPESHGVPAERTILFIDDILIERAEEPLGEESDSETVTIPDLEIAQMEIPDTEQMRFALGLKCGWNLGNTLDAQDGRKAGDNLELETCWQPVRTTRELIAAVHEAGYETIRIPVSWHNHLEEGFLIREAWLDRVQEIVDYCMDEGVFVILNVHHDNDPQSACLYPDTAHFAQSEEFLTSIWTQVSERFAAYDEHLIFESMNEPRLVGHALEWNPDASDPDVRDAMDCINRLNQAFVDTVRSAGGFNESRYLMCPGYSASPEGLLSEVFQIPQDPAQHLLLSAHAYRPYNFTLNKTGTALFSANSVINRREIEWFTKKLYEAFIKDGIPVVIGETGAMDKNGNLQARVDFATFFTAQSRACGMPCIWWDNGTFSGSGEIFGIIDREKAAFRFPQIPEAMARYSGY